MENMLLTTSGAAETATATVSTADMLIQFLPIVLIVVVFYFLLIRPQKKRDKEVQKMRSNLQVGDEIVTAGGIIGRVVSVKEDTILIESGSDRSRFRIARWAVQQNNTAAEAAAAAAQASKNAKAASKDEEKK